MKQYAKRSRFQMPVNWILGKTLHRVSRSMPIFYAQRNDSHYFLQFCLLSKFLTRGRCPDSHTTAGITCSSIWGNPGGCTPSCGVSLNVFFSSLHLSYSGSH